MNQKKVKANAGNRKKGENPVAKMNLIYINDKAKGIDRKKRGNKFIYFYESKQIKEQREIERINKLVIPPAWKNVWICPNANGYLQATGIDSRKRKQYKYHSLWNKKRSEKKYDRLLEFGKVLPDLRQKIEKDIRQNVLTKEKVLATVISLIERTSIRVGNSFYEKENGSYGLTTLKDKHVTIAKDTLRLSFLGKKGIHHSISLKSKRLARIVKACKEIPGKELFQYYDEVGKRHSIDSGMVNTYIREALQSDFTAKDFRTWAGSLNMICAFRNFNLENTGKDLKNNLNVALDYVSQKLGNTKTVCKNYYVHPLVLTLCEDNSIAPFLKTKRREKNQNPYSLTDEEQILMRILESGNLSRKKVA